MTRYLVACLHARRESPIIHFVDTDNRVTAVLLFLAWHDKCYPHRRAYNVTVYEML